MSDSTTLKDKILSGLNFILMLDLFFVIFSFFWFAIALVGRSIDVPLGFNLWYRLWEPVFMPAIGLLMGGSLVVGITRWISTWFSKQFGSEG
ncbi:MAG: hypothetical protein WBA57_08295 [Elainellaceae cyanobacterium]